jgi:phage terminase small subunit
LKILRGNPGKEALNKNEPEPWVPPNVPDAPILLNAFAGDEWYRIAEELYPLKLSTIVDLKTLAAYCQVYGRRPKGRRKRWSKSKKIVPRNGGPTIHRSIALHANEPMITNRV